MNHTINRSVYILLILTVTGSCIQRNRDQDTENDLALIHEMHRTYRLGVENGDLDLFMSIWAEDAIRMESELNCIVGKEKIRDHFGSAFEQFNIKVNVYGDKVIRIEGDLAYSHANFLVSLNPKGTDTTFHTDFKYLEIYEKQEDGMWKLKVGSAMTNPQWSDEKLSPDLLKSEDTSVPKL